MHGQLAETRQRYQIYVIPAVKTIPAVKQGWITNLQSQYPPVVNTLGSQTKSHFPTRRKTSPTVTIPTGPVVKIFYLHVQYPPVVTPFPSPAVKPPHHGWNAPTCGHNHHPDLQWYYSTVVTAHSHTVEVFQPTAPLTMVEMLHQRVHYPPIVTLLYDQWNP